MELLVLICLVMVLVIIMALAGDAARRRARLAGSLDNLKQHASGYHAYSADSADRFATFSWRAGTDYGFGGIAGTDLQAASNQAVDILRRRAERPDIGPISNWIPQLAYNHLLLVDYLGEELPARWAVSPGDTARLAWQRDPRNFLALNPNGRPAQPGSGSTAARWPYSSSYEVPPAFFSPDQIVGNVQTIAQANWHNTYLVGSQNVAIGQRLMSQVAFPSHKAMTYETVQRFFGPRQAYFTYEEARIPVLTADGSAGVRGTESCNRGFQPNNPTSTQPSIFEYAPDLGYEPATLNGQPREFVVGHMRWTRRGLLGRDFGAPQVP